MILIVRRLWHAFRRDVLLITLSQHVKDYRACPLDDHWLTANYIAHLEREMRVTEARISRHEERLAKLTPANRH